MFVVRRTSSSLSVYFFFFNETATTEIYTLSLHDALPILAASGMSPEEIEETKRDPEKVKIYLRDYYSKTNQIGRAHV